MKEFLLIMSLYLLGSARGASGKPDKTPGSLNQASVQRFSGEHFSLANPSGKEALYVTSPGKIALSERPLDEHTLVGRALGEHSSGKHASGEPGSGEHAAGSDHAAEEQPVGEKAFGEQPSGEQPSGEQPSGEQPSGGKPLGEQSLDEKPSGEQVSGEDDAGEPVSGEQASGEQDSGEKRMDEPPSESPVPNTSSDSVLKCLTCSYMNDQGKCLRGEGVCTTQKSQQCMLKKIFEGGKLQFMVQGCENMCPSMNLFSHGTRMHIICCKNQSFCNKI
ncbi:acrosomal protein SP-10 isoform X1 [Pteronotus mesoamericanus]|uniref:acrosomal protein SP-10 isoform X1 n=1 Tax=Pteronotus mesoamericanus TaxID=1884717 RepID=UPI0023ECEFAF|nr:acrosomal protein SP-10 isoform X1 [Pteronotus parnellii mesoamericanus]